MILFFAGGSIVVFIIVTRLVVVLPRHRHLLAAHLNRSSRVHHLGICLGDTPIRGGESNGWRHETVADL